MLYVIFTFFLTCILMCSILSNQQLRCKYHFNITNFFEFFHFYSSFIKNSSINA
jgi:hypothetical protein